MKTLVLKENQVIYETAITESLREGEAVILERDGHPIAALVPIEEYEAFRAWKENQQTMTPIDWSEDRTIEEVVADIKKRGPGVPNFREATASFADLLANAPHDPDFNLEAWEREWANVEAEIEADDPYAL